jgi:hypothetical protein
MTMADRTSDVAHAPLPAPSQESLGHLRGAREHPVIGALAEALAPRYELQERDGDLILVPRSRHVEFGDRLL